MGTTEKTISQQVDHLLTGLSDDQRPVFLHSFVSGLVDRLANAEKSVMSGLLLFVAIWAASYLVSKGFVQEVTQSGFKLSQVQYLLIAAPVALGFVSYSVSAALTVAMVLEEVVREIYCKALPALRETNLKSLFWSHGFIGAEHHDVLTTRSRLESYLSLAVGWGVVAFFWLGSLFAIIHVAGMAERLHQWPGPIIFLSTGLGCLLWFRGAVMIYHRTAH
jgi:hypothetical protein